jgi:acyl carrier protein
MTVGSQQSFAEIVARLQELLAEVWAGNDRQPVDGDLPLRDLGVESGAVVALLARVQSEFSVEWPDDLPPGALESLTKVAQSVVQARTTA